jgi:hypothetical protein
MDSLENKLERLTPGQRREVEDFVDFLFQQSGTSPASKILVQQALPPMLGVAPPAFTVQDSPMNPEAPRINVHDLIHAADLPARPPVYDVSSPPIQEITVSGEDLLTHDYMDYGQFDQSSRQPSPATEAVKNVKMKMSRKDTEDRTSQLFDWID